MATIDVKDAAGSTVAIPMPNANGRAAAALSRPVALSTEDAAYLDGIETSLGAVADAAWASGSGSMIALLKAIAGAAIDTSTASPVSVQTPADVVTVTPTLDTSAYTAGDVLFDSTAFTAMRVNDGRALLQSVVVIDKDDQKPSIKLHFFSANVSLGTFNAAPSISDANAANFLGSVAISASDYDDLGGVSVACVKGVNLLLEAVSGAQTVYVAATTSTTPTHTAAGLVFRLGLIQC